MDPAFAPHRGDIDLYRASASIDTSVDCDFRVLDLKVLFDNSRIESFDSHIQLTINKLFGGTVHSTSRQNLMILKGSHENHNGNPSYTFHETGDHQLLLDQLVPKRLDLVKSTFTTILPKDTAQAYPNRINARFSFWGFINFNALEGLDLFSFGSKVVDGQLTAESHRGLYFSNLYIDLAVDLQTPTERIFTFDVEAIASISAIARRGRKASIPSFHSS